MINEQVTLVEFASGKFGVKRITTVFKIPLFTCFLSYSNTWKWYSYTESINKFCMFSTKEQAYTHMQQYLLTHKEL